MQAVIIFFCFFLRANENEQCSIRDLIDPNPLRVTLRSDRPYPAIRLDPETEKGWLSLLVVVLHRAKTEYGEYDSDALFQSRFNFEF